MTPIWSDFETVALRDAADNGPVDHVRADGTSRWIGDSVNQSGPDMDRSSDTNCVGASQPIAVRMQFLTTLPRLYAWLWPQVRDPAPNVKSVARLHSI